MVNNCNTDKKLNIKSQRKNRNITSTTKPGSI